MAALPHDYSWWAALVAERAPLPSDVFVLTAAEREELARLRGTRRLPPKLFGRKVAAEKVAS